jgi:hypothetical protein
MTIDLSKFDQNKTYVGVEVGDSVVAKAIQFQTSKFSKLPKKQTASHVLALAFVEGIWRVYESHLMKGGVVSYPAQEFNTKNVTFIEYPLNIEVLKYYSDFNYPYGCWDIFSKVFNLKNDGGGLICSEYIALADTTFAISRHFELKANIITPAHIQRYLKEQNS